MTEHEPDGLPMEFSDEGRRALVSTWWTGMLLRKNFRRFFRKAVGSEAQFNVLMVLHHATDPLTQNDLGGLLLIDKSNVTGLIDRMENDGLVRRNTVPDDRRSYHITLTDKGTALIADIEPQYARKVDRVMGQLTPDERRELTRLTQKLRTALHALD